mgnify:CR=1 FL=1
MSAPGDVEGALASLQQTIERTVAERAALRDLAANIGGLDERSLQAFGLSDLRALVREIREQARACLELQ